MVRVKICGITNSEDASKAVYYGAWALGFIFYKKSPRYISPSRARKIIEDLPPFVTPVGVFVNHKERAVADICHFTRIQTIQLHGDETEMFCRRLKNYKIIKAFRIHDRFDFSKIASYPVSAFLFDTYQEGVEGGTGKTFSWSLLNEQKFKKPFILSGGLNPQNVQEAIRETQPFAVDVTSGVEKSPGIKDPQLMKAFLKAIPTDNF